MKTLILNGSPKINGDTATLINALSKDLNGEIRIISSVFDNISPCIDCRYCWQNDGCAIKDDMQDVYSYFEECDNLVLASPIWFSGLSGPLLNIASRIQTYFAARWFRHELSKIKHKNGLLLLVGAEAHTAEKAAAAAYAVFKQANALPCIACVSSLNTNNVPAAEDNIALRQIYEAALNLNKLYLEKIQ